MSNQFTTVNYATATGSAIADTDFSNSEGTLTFAPGETTKTITVSIVADSLKEITETFQLNLSNALHASIFAKGIGTILDNN